MLNLPLRTLRLLPTCLTLTLPAIGTAQDPYPGPAPHAIPGRIEAEYYDQGGEGLAYHDQSPGNQGGIERQDDVDLAKGGSGTVVAWTEEGEWLSYQTTSKAGRYDLLVHAVKPRGTPGRLRLFFDDLQLAEVEIPPTGSIQFGPPIIVPDIELPDKTGSIRIAIENGGFNLDAIQFVSRKRDAREKNALINRLENYQPQTVVLYGTSLTARYGGHFIKEMNRRYQGLFHGINSAKPGMGSNWGIEHLQERVLEKKPDAVLIEFAINDAYLPRNTTVPQARANLENMIDQIQNANSEVAIILLNLIPPVESHAETRPALADYYAMYQEVARERALPLIDVHAHFETILRNDPERFRVLVPDGIHPGAEGSQDLIVPTILKALGAES